MGQVGWDGMGCRGLGEDVAGNKQVVMGGKSTHASEQLDSFDDIERSLPVDGENCANTDGRRQSSDSAGQAPRVLAMLIKWVVRSVS